MRADAAYRQTFGKNSSPGFVGRMTLTGQGLVLGAGTLLAKLDDKALPIEADQERIWTLVSVAYGHEVPLAVLGSLRRVAKHGKAAANVSPRFIWRRPACRKSAKTPGGGALSFFGGFEGRTGLASA